MELLSRDKAPPYARAPFVLHGYRPVGSAVGLFRLHNETANVWSHLLPCGFMVLRVCETAMDASIVDTDARRFTIFFQ